MVSEDTLDFRSRELAMEPAVSRGASRQRLRRGRLPAITVAATAVAAVGLVMRSPALRGLAWSTPPPPQDGARDGQESLLSRRQAAQTAANAASLFLALAPTAASAEADNLRIAELEKELAALREKEVQARPPPMEAPQLPESFPRTGTVVGINQEFAIKCPAGWKTKLANYPGGFLTTSEKPKEEDPFAWLTGSDMALSGDLAAMRVAKLTLPSLAKTGGYVPRPSDETSSNWNDVTVGNVTASTCGDWLMQAYFKSLESQLGFPIATKTEVLDSAILPGGEVSRLVFHASVTYLPPPDGAMGMGMQPPGADMQGLNGRVMTLNDAMAGQAAAPAAVPSERPKRLFTGSALLYGGVVYVALADAPPVRYDPGFVANGTTASGEFLDYLVGTLALVDAPWRRTSEGAAW
eukprot:TRINITY_DN123232_c0_g1_i1.p1 TRINITY_DN123232_c0_g1~~TRINITY_DN123232_c0_g1_i1.p1  ORF type:complete len:409 (-),score=115.91 TRINITY_DN123232_c0_g1_i1:204-1430(-)